jgi:D-tyrosyl-tRNA(Tyr) deacylase
MRIVIQRVSEASVKVNGELINEINQGFLLLIGIENEDDESDVMWLVQKCANLRIFNDQEGKMNLSLADINGETLVISQFTLHGSTKKGNRPSFIKAARPEKAIPLYELFCEKLETENLVVKRGIFGADMQVELLNDGPVTILIDSKNRE